MTYSEADIKKYIKARRRDFFIKILLSFLLILIALAAIIIFPEATVIFVCAAVILFSIIYIFKVLRRYQPRTLFSREIKGVNIKEHEFAVTNRRPTFSARLVMPRANAKSFTGGKTRTKSPTSAIVYLRLPDGDVTYIDNLTNAQTDIYEIGDTLYKYAGTRYPIILERKLDAQPCPLCGTANKSIEDCCITCGLKICK